MIGRIFKCLLIVSIILLGATIQPEPAQAFVKASGSFVATDTCPALQSIRKQTNPGSITTIPSTTYELLGKNKRDATYYQIRVIGAEPTARWVAINCGNISDESIAGGNGSVPGNGGATSESPDYLLAASWQPGFCETKPDKPECESQTADRFDATNFSIHGLWPQPRDNVYCDVSADLIKADKDRRWFDLPELVLSAETRRELQTKMPGYQSGLHRHEWYKHGTCYSDTPEEYYQETIALLDQLNASGVRTFLAQNLERDITDDQLAQAFDAEFDAGSKVQIRCKEVDGENLIQELFINLRGEIEEDTDIANLLAAAPDTRTSRRCSEVQVDSVDERSADERPVDERPVDELPVTITKLEDGRLQILIDVEKL